MNLLQKAVSLAVASFFLCASPAALAKTILYVPQDDRPVDYEYTVSTAEAASVSGVAPEKPSTIPSPLVRPAIQIFSPEM